MTRKIRGMVLLAACVGLWSCSSDPTADQAGVPDKIVSLPSIIFVNVDSSENMGFQLVDALDGQVPAEFTITNTSTFFNVVVDSLFRPVYNPDGTLVVPAQPTEVRATVTGVTAGKDSFLVEAGGKSLYIPVQVIPNLLDATFSSLTPGLSDTVTITAPANVLFTPTSVVTFPGAATASYQIAVDPAGAWIKVFVAANTHTSAQITNVTLSSSPTLRFTYRTTDTVTAAVLTALPATFSTLAPAGTPVTMTANAGFKFDTTSAVSFASPQTAPIINSRTDSSAITFSVAPNINSTVRVTKVHAVNVPQIVYTLASVGTMVSPVITSFPGAISNAAPVWGDTVTVSITGGGYKFSPTSAVSWGTKPANIVSRAADSLSITVIPTPGSIGVPTVTLVTNAVSYPPFAVTLLGSAGSTMTLAANPTNLTPATATALPLTAFYWDNGVMTGACAGTLGGGVGCQYYKITLAAAGSRTFTFTWSNTSDLGIYFYDSAMAALGSPSPYYACDNNGSGATSQPETCTVNFPAAGTYILEMNKYSSTTAVPGGVGIKIQ
jgi:hypothetical protein